MQRILDLVVSVLIVVFVIYLLKMVFVKGSVQVPILTPVLSEI